MDLEDWSNGKKGEAMSAKLERLGAELANARRKKAIWEAKVKELEVRYREEENTEIHDMVHAANLTPEQLAELLRKFSENKILQPEEMLMQAVLIKQFTDRQLSVSPEVIAYILKNMERSFKAASQLTQKADELSLAERRAITIPLIRKVLNELQDRS